MARIAGIDLPKNKRGIIGLTYIFGVGKKTSAEILTKAGIAFEKRVLTWTDEEIASIRAAIADYKVEGQLPRTRKGRRKTVAGKKKAAKK